MRKSSGTNRKTTKVTAENSVAPSKQTSREVLPAHIVAKGVPRELRDFQNPQSSNNELVVRYTDYFDSPAIDGSDFQQFLYGLDSDPLNAGTDGGPSTAQLSRVLDVNVYALPRWAVSGIVDASLMVLFGVPCRVGPDATDANILNTCQRSTLLTPTANTHWVKVGGWSAKQLYKADQLPAFAVDEAGAQTLDQALCSLLLVDPDDMTVYTGTSKPQVQYRIEWTVAHPMPPITTTKFNVTSIDNIQWGSVIDVTTTQQPCVGNVLKMRDVV
jgi:hypothetical protein